MDIATRQWRFENGVFLLLEITMYPSSLSVPQNEREGGGGGGVRGREGGAKE